MHSALHGKPPYGFGYTAVSCYNILDLFATVMTAMGPTAGEAARIRALRKRLGLSQEQLAKRLGVSFVTVNRWEAGRTRASAAVLRRIAELEDSQTVLPVVPSAFVGRAAEIDAVVALLDSSRLVSLIGVGGAGKTRLAAEVARRVGSTAVRLVFVALDSVTEPGLVDARVAAALGLRDRAGMSHDEAVVRALAADASLLVLDGAEHVVADQAGHGIARLAERILTDTAATRILVTSRRLLGIPGEQVWPVPALRPDEAMRLFTARARERVPGFDLTEELAGPVAELCRRLDALPLAIELAAAWVGTLSVRQILERKSELLGPVAGSRTMHTVADSRSSVPPSRPCWPSCRFSRARSRSTTRKRSLARTSFSASGPSLSRRGWSPGPMTASRPTACSTRCANTRPPGLPPARMPEQYAQPTPGIWRMT